MQIVPLALEVRMRLHCQHNVEIACIAAVAARIAFPLVADARAIFHARRNLHLDGVLLLHAPFTDAGVARFDDHLTGSAADGAGACDGEETLLEAHLPAAGALLANRRRLALRGAGAAALPANVHALDGDSRLLAEDRLLEFDRQVVADIAAALCARCPPAASPGNVEHLSEKVSEDIANTHAAREPPRPASTAYSGDTIAIVGRTLLGIAQHLVSLARLLEALLRFRIVRIAVRVIAHRQFAVCGLQLLLAALSCNAQDFVIIDVGHVCHFSCTRSSVQPSGGMNPRRISDRDIVPSATLAGVLLTLPTGSGSRRCAPEPAAAGAL